MRRASKTLAPSESGSSCSFRALPAPLRFAQNDSRRGSGTLGDVAAADGVRGERRHRGRSSLASNADPGANRHDGGGNKP